MLIVVAPQSIALSMQRQRKSCSEREPSSHDHSTSSHKERAWVTLSITAWWTSSGVFCSLTRMCKGLVAMKVWMRFCAAGCSASAARSMSLRLARASEQTMLSLIRLATSRTAWKSPGEAIAKPASMTSTPICSSSSAILTFSATVIEAPGDCSPSRKVVSKTTMRSSGRVCLIWLGRHGPIPFLADGRRSLVQ